MEKIKLSDVIVVEGKYDKIKLSSFVDAVILTTGGFGVFNSREKFHNIKYKAKNKNGVYVNCTSRGTVLHGEGTDPDLFAGILIFSDENQ